jgi:ligand-binding sensor protein
MPPKNKVRYSGQAGSRKERQTGKGITAPGRNNKSPRTAQSSLAGILDLGDVQGLQKAFAGAFGIASVILDRNGKAITDYVGFSSVLNTVARKDGLTFLTCMEPSVTASNARSMEPVVEQCPRCGLLYGIIPITAGSHRLASWLVGQVLNKDIDVEDLIAGADAMGVDRETYSRARPTCPG